MEPVMTKANKNNVRNAFLKTLWNEIPSDDSTVWRKQLGPQLAGRIDRLLSGQGAEADVLAIVRQANVNLLLSFVEVLDTGHPGQAGEASDTRWGLFEVDEADHPGRKLGTLHETVFGLDPTGRMAEPPDDRPAAKPKKKKV